MKWILGILCLIGVVVAGVWGLGKYVMQHANEEGTFSAEVYEQMVEAKLLSFCNDYVKRKVKFDGSSTQAQFESTCKCFANDMFERLRAVPPDELEAQIKSALGNKSAGNIFKKCGYAAGLN